MVSSPACAVAATEDGSIDAMPSPEPTFHDRTIHLERHAKYSTPIIETKSCDGCLQCGYVYATHLRLGGIDAGRHTQTLPVRSASGLCRRVSRTEFGEDLHFRGTDNPARHSGRWGSRGVPMCFDRGRQVASRICTR